jgi:PAS domain S-box-containing protein
MGPYLHKGTFERQCVVGPQPDTPENHPPERPNLLSGIAARLQEGFRALRQSHAQRLAAIVEFSDDAIISVDLEGTIATWNQGAQRLLGYTAEEVVTEPVVMLIPSDREGEEDEILGRIRRGERIAHFRTERRHKDGTLVPVSLSVSPIRDGNGSIIGASKIARDMTEQDLTRNLLERRMEEQAALYEFTDRLFRAHTVEDIYEAGLDAIIRALGCDLASILMFDNAGAMKFVAARGLSEGYKAAVEGHSPWTRETKDAQPIALADVEAADLVPALQATIKAEGIAALAFIPLTAKGALVGKFMAYYKRPHEFTDKDIELAVIIARQLGFSVERLRADEAKALVAGETQHRIKNTLATVQAIAAQTLRHVPAEDLRGFLGRLQALGEAQELLTREHWDQAPLREVLARALKPFGERIALEGPGVSLPARTSLMLTMCLHELATNAAKYGALSNGTGKVSLAWNLVDGGKVRLHWQESGGPVVAAPTHKGFGSRLIEQAFGAEGEACIRFARDGVECVLQTALD